MGKMKKICSLKWSFLLYLPLCLIAAYAGSFGIGIVTNHLQDSYRSSHSLYNDSAFEIKTDKNGDINYYFDESPSDSGYDAKYFIISNAQFILIPLWVIFCVGAMGAIFYNRELKKPIDILMSASKKISENKLDFKVEYNGENELGMLCNAFDDMRQALYENNREMWRSLEERKRLNSAFSHDLRTPLTVLHGYSDFLQKYVPDGRITEEKLMSVLSMMNGQIIRLEHYTQKMNAVQKLEDIVPEYSEISSEDLYKMFEETGNLISKDKNFTCTLSPYDKEITLTVDKEIIMQIYENLLSNAVRYTKDSVETVIFYDTDKFGFSVSDNGDGFTDEALQKAAEPFFRDEKEQDKTHFGLGLYICRILCEKCGGTMNIRNNRQGGATAEIIFPK
jgi:signal transduction histidine kinase